MLTKQDLQAIGNVIDEKLDKRFKEVDEGLDKHFAEFDKKISGRFNYIDHELEKFESDLKIAKIDIEATRNEIETIQKDIKKIRKDLKITINHFDEDYVDLHKRVDRLEEHTGIPTTTT